jgi:uncharacterized integral membrane protein (TIGR00698 family)
MGTKFFTQFKNEDWIATILGSVLVLGVIIFPKFMTNIYVIFASIGILAAIGLKILGSSLRGFAISYTILFLISLFAQYLSGISFIKTTGFEAVFFSVAIGLIIRNTIGLPKWLEPSVRSEYYIKAGLVLLGTSILFGEIMKAGALGMVQAVVVVISVWYFSFWLAKKFGVDKEMALMLSSAVSICGVSAAIATCGAIKGDSKKLSFVISIVLVIAVPMMYLMPYLSKLLGLSQEVAGAWLGGTIDTTGAVVASGKFLGDIAEKYSVIIKSSQNVLLGIAAFAISIYWSFKGTNKDIKPSASVLWERFPKFVLGFVVASLVFSFLFEPNHAKDLSKIAKGLRETLFSIAFVSIGLETDFKRIFNNENKKYIFTFLIAQTFNILLTLGVAYLLFGNYSYFN